jgi:hypothetical protein
MAQQLLALLGAFDEKWTFLLVCGFIFGLTWLWRRFAPGLWAAAVAKSPTLPQLPLLVLAALMTANPASGKDLFDVVQQTVLQSILAVLGANGLHAILKASSLPYTGAEKKVESAIVKRGTPPGGIAKLDGPVPPPKP